MSESIELARKLLAAEAELEKYKRVANQLSETLDDLLELCEMCGLHGEAVYQVAKKQHAAFEAIKKGTT